MPIDQSFSPALPVTLRRRFHLLNARYNRVFTWGMAGILLLPLVLVLSVMAIGTGALPEGRLGKLLEMLRGEVAGDPAFMAALFVLPLVAIFVWLQFRHERLVLSDNGIEYRSPLRGPLGFLHRVRPDWRLPWTDVAAVGLKEGGSRAKQLSLWRLVFRERDGTVRTLVPYHWYALPDLAGLSPSRIMRSDANMCREAVERSPLYRVVADRGLLEPGTPVPEEAAPDYDLSSHKGLWALVIAFFLLGGYAVADTFFLTPWRFEAQPPPGPFVVAGLAALVVGTLVSRGAPPTERWAVGALFVAAAVGAVYPAMLRVNAATDPDGVSGYRYRQVAVGEFMPIDREGLPRLSFTRGMEFWQSLPAGGEREFRLARGDLGFWQLDLSAVRADQRAFYRDRSRDGE